eukprot:CAMPEP_0119108162 /NCGR_PEP_ID=MMETSP1180-20130426/13501_1 /TAXON_ID=3052 ORGANISM="Chlamydomonas cf sp, Strain CCMP681" /NCGR_SAMPLE_ID=MMETSP1180 /ASSEMBLY_ACC=CAM_ASM_000741 /LENGTH=280 /DNA_ID=CAMNT_0007093749 /DNA_START=36 /DNA_END=878 /DNA_ORIENTATION=+
MADEGQHHDLASLSCPWLGLSAVMDEHELGCWRPAEHKDLETALAMHVDNPDRWELVAAHVGNRAAWQVQHYYQQLEDDVRRIEEGLTSVPVEWGQPESHLLDLEDFEESGQGGLLDVSLDMSYDNDDINDDNDNDPPHSPPCKKAKLAASLDHASRTAAKKRATGEQNRPGELRKGVPWTEEEHHLFLEGLAKYGKGDWRSIARNFVLTRTPTQVASHAQKYFIRLQTSLKSKNKRRASIHDIHANAQALQAQQAQHVLDLCMSQPCGMLQAGSQLDVY